MDSMTSFHYNARALQQCSNDFKGQRISQTRQQTQTKQLGKNSYS